MSTGDGPYRNANMVLAQGPRTVPFALKARLYNFNLMSILGWSLISFGMIFVWVFAMQSDVASLWQWDGPLERTPARIVSSRATSNKINKSYVYEFTYVFTGPDGAEHGGRSYQTGGYVRGNPEAEFPSGNPGRSRLRGMRTSVWGPWGSLLGLIPIVGVFFVSFGLLRGRRAVTLLSRGKVARGKLVRRAPTNVRVNGQRVMRLTFMFQSDDGRSWEAEAKTHQTHLLMDDAEEQLLYHPVDPRYSTLMDHLPGGPRVGADGQLEMHGGNAGGLLALALPLLALGPHLIVYLALFA
jgi:hypothetical protein